MAIKKFLSQKVYDPNIDNENRSDVINPYIETMYIQEDTNKTPYTPIIYWRGKLADNNSIEARNLPDGVIASRHIAGNATDDTSRAITTDKIRNQAITTDKLNEYNFGAVIKTKRTETKYNGTGVLIFRPLKTEEQKL